MTPEQRQDEHRQAKTIKLSFLFSWSGYHLLKSGVILVRSAPAEGCKLGLIFGAGSINFNDLWQNCVCYFQINRKSFPGKSLTN